MTNNWGALGVVAAVSLVVGVLLVVLVSFALVGLSAREPDPAGVPADGAAVTGRGLSPLAGAIVAAVCFLGAAAIAILGLFLLVF
jgi:hypothetical protein